MCFNCAIMNADIVNICMNFTVLSLFPEMFESFQRDSIVGRAVKEEKINFELMNIRDFGIGKHRQVDDTPYGGGEGMLMMCEPLFTAFENVECKTKNVNKRRIIYMTPQGESFTQQKAAELAEYDELVILCGRYEGVDQRVRDELIDEEISIGDYVLTGGEIPAMVVMDSVIRLLPGVLGKEGSHVNDSFSEAFDGKREHPHYTKPADFNGMKVPDVLLSGNHAEIEKWRRENLR